MDENLLLELGYNGIEHLIAQLQDLRYYDIPTAHVDPTPSGSKAVWGKITGVITDQKDLMTTLNSLQETIESAIIEEIGAVFTYKGTVPTYEDLPTSDQEKGDVWNVAENGANYAWNGSEWDKLSETIDLEGYVTKDLFEETIQLYYIKEEVDNLINVLKENLETKIEEEKVARENDIIDVKNLISAEGSARVTAVNELSALIQQEINERIVAVAAVDNKVEDLKAEVNDLKNGLDNYYTKPETNDLLDTKVNKTDIFKNGVFTTENTKANGTYTKIWNESDGGGTQIIDGVSNVQAYTGVHEGSDGTNIYVQTYAVDKNSKVGTRINVNKDGAYLTKGKNTYTFTEDDAIVTKGQMDNADAALQTAIDKVAEDLQKHIDDAETGFVTNAEFDEEVTARESADNLLQANIAQVAEDLAEHIADADANAATKAELNDEANARMAADNLLEDEIEDIKINKANVDDVYTKAEVYTKQETEDAIDAKTSAMFRYKGQVETVAELPIENNHVGDVWNVVETGANYAWDGTEWDKLSETIDLSGYYKKTETDTLLNKKTDKELQGANGKALIFNETDGGGAKFESNDGHWSFAGVNDMSDANKIGVQLYNIDRNNGNVGPRINLTPDRATYSKTKTEVGEAYELVIKKDINDLTTDVNNKITTETSERTQADTALQEALDVTISNLEDEIENRANADVALDNKITDVQTTLTQEINNREVAETALKANIDDVDARLTAHIEEAEDDYASKIDLANEITSREAADTVLDDRIKTLEDKDYVLYTNISDKDNPNRKAIILDNHNGIFGKDTEGNTRTLGMISKYNVADFGNPHLHTNLNTQQIVTINDDQAVLTDSNLGNILIAGENVNIVAGQQTDPSTGFIFNTYTFSADLEGTTTRLDKEIQDRIDADSVLQEHIDTKAEQVALDAEIANRQSADTNIISKIWSNNTMNGGYFQTKYNHNSGSYAQIWNESDGGGSQVYDKLDNIKSYVGTNLEDGKGADDDAINVQIYSVNDTSKEGVRINVNNHKAYYLQGSSKSNVNEREIAVKGDITSLETDVQAQIDAIEEKLSAVFHYKGTVATYEELPTDNVEIGDVWNISADGSNYAWNGTEWDNLAGVIDLSNYYTKAEVDEKDLAIMQRIWSNPSNPANGYFQTKYNHANGSYAMLWNESDGGGSLYFNKTSNIKSYVGTNDATGTEQDDITVQIYAVDDTTKTGTRVNFNANGAYYVKGEKGQGNPETREIAVKEDVAEVQSDLEALDDKVTDTLATQDGNIAALLLKMAELESRIEDLKSLDPEIVVLYDGSDSSFSNKEKDFILSGTITTTTNISGNSVTLKDATVTASSVAILSSSDTTIKNVTLTGKVPKAISNYLFSVKADGYVNICDSTINPETAYNGIEVGLSTGLAKSVIIDNVDFAGHFSNNGINVFGMADGGVVTVSNCHFADLSNAIRLSNRTNTAWTVNIINCTFDKWETGKYAGMILMQDYTSGSQTAAEENNMFHKLTINIQNCTKPDGTKIVAPDNLADICSTQDDNQIIYMWDEWRNFTEYTEDKFPTINII